MAIAPTIGRVVHYVSYGTPGAEFLPTCRAAIITDTESSRVDPHEAVSVCVFNPTGLFFNSGIPHDEDERAGGSWHWIVSTNASPGCRS